jgi:hypothetical protein
MKKRTNNTAKGGSSRTTCSEIFAMIARLSIDYTGYELTADPKSVEEIKEAVRTFRIDRENETDRQLCLFEKAVREILSQNAEPIHGGKDA